MNRIIRSGSEENGIGEQMDAKLDALQQRTCIHVRAYHNIEMLAQREMDRRSNERGTCSITFFSPYFEFRCEIRKCYLDHRGARGFGPPRGPPRRSKPLDGPVLVNKWMKARVPVVSAISKEGADVGNYV